MRSMILYSVIIPVYNTGRYLMKCLESVRRQTYNNWEIILIDDGSSDAETIKICDRYAEADNRIKVFHKKNQGCFMARESGIRLATGEYCLFLDSDDYYYADLLSEVNNMILQEQPQVLLFRSRRDGAKIHKLSPKLFDNGTIIEKGSKDWKKLVRILLTTPNLNNLCFKAVKRELATIDLNQYVGIIYGEDRLKSIPILLEAKKILYLNKVLYCYRNNPDSLTHISVSENLEQRCRSHFIMQNAEIKFLKQYDMDNEEYMSMYYQTIFRRKIDLITAIKDVGYQNNKELVKKILIDVNEQKILRYCKMHDMKFKYALYFWLYKRGKLIDFYCRK